VTPTRAAYVAAFVTFGVVGVISFGRAAIAGSWADLLINAPFLTVLLGAPLAAAAGILTYRWRTATDSPATDPRRPGDEWIAAIHSELAAVEDRRERRRFAGEVLVVVVRRTLTARTLLLAVCVAGALALGLLGLSRATLGFGDGVGLYTLFVPPLVFFGVGAVAAKRLCSFSRGLILATAVAVLSAIAMLPVAATESAYWYSEAGVALLDGEPVTFDSASAAVLDTFHPVFIVLHLLFWLPGAVLGARLGARPEPLDPPSRHGAVRSPR
jgi:predicted outer membrane lipoprotein